MTWLPVAGGTSELEAVLDLQPDSSRLLLHALAVAHTVTDRRLVELSRLRMAQVLGCRHVLAAADPHLLAELEDDRRPASLSELECAAVAYAEQFVMDAGGLAGALTEELAQHLSPRELANFVQTLSLHESFLRVATLFDLAPDPAERPSPFDPRQPDAGSPGQPDEAFPAPSPSYSPTAALMDPGLWEARGAFANAAKVLPWDDVTSELLRLLNASYTACHR